MTRRDFLVVVCRRQLYDPCPAGSGTAANWFDNGFGAFLTEKRKADPAMFPSVVLLLGEFSVLFPPILSHLIVKFGFSDHPSHVSRLSLVCFLNGRLAF
jgi:hypothetical protein